MEVCRTRFPKLVRLVVAEMLMLLVRTAALDFDSTESPWLLGAKNACECQRSFDNQPINEGALSTICLDGAEDTTTLLYKPKPFTHVTHHTYGKRQDLIPLRYEWEKNNDR
jgi:hypothetical protein